MTDHLHYNFHRIHLRELSPFVVASIGPIVALLFVIRYGANLAIADDWNFGTLLLRWHDHSIDWDSLFSPHNEHRIAIARLIWYAAAELFGWNLKLSMCLGVLSLASASLLLTRHLQKFLGDLATHEIAGISAACSLMLCSVAQWQNLLWGFQLPWLLLPCVLFGALGGAAHCVHSWSRAAALGAFAIAAIFVNGNGILIGPIAALSLVMAPGVPLKDRCRKAAVVAGPAMLVGIVCMRTLCAANMFGETSILSVVQFFLREIGHFPLSPWISDYSSTRVPLALAGLVGSLAIGAAAILNVLAVRLRLISSASVRFGNGCLLYGAGSAMLVAISRAKFGIDFAFQSRYLTFTILFYVGLWIVLISILLNASTRCSLRRRCLCLWVPTISVFALSLVQWNIFAQQGKDLRRVYNYMRSAIYAGPAFAERAGVARISPDHTSETIVALAGALSTRGLIRPGLLANRIEAAGITPSREGAIAGHIDGLERRGAQITITGWAMNPDTRGLVDAVFAAVPASTLGYQILAMADYERIARPDVANFYNAPELDHAGWTLSFSSSGVSLGDVVVLGYNVDSGRFFPIDATPLRVW